MTYDIGTHGFILGLLYILLPYVVPFILIVILGAGILFGVNYFIAGNISMPTNKNWLLLFLCAVLLILIVSLT